MPKRKLCCLMTIILMALFFIPPSETINAAQSPQVIVKPAAAETSVSYFIMAEDSMTEESSLAPTERLSGSTRYHTAVEISRKGWQTADSVVLAGGWSFADALAGTALAGLRDAPVLLTPPDALPPEILAELQRLNAKRIYLLGGESVISRSVEDALAKLYSVKRIAGNSRFETAAHIGEEIISQALHIDTVIIATGYNYPDTLAIAPFAGRHRIPILFTETDTLNENTKQALAVWQVKKAIIAGGTGVVSGQVEETLKTDLQMEVTRLAGENRYLTCLEIAKHFENSAAMSKYQRAALATGTNFPDALAGASLAAKYNCPVLLVTPDSVGPETKNYLKSLKPEKIYIFGGEEAISDQVILDLQM